MSPIWHLYLLECADGSLYAGISTDVGRRFAEHVAGRGGRYTRSHKPIRLVASRPVGSRSAALKAELAIKRLPKERKVAALTSPLPLAKSDNHQQALNKLGSKSMNKSELIDITASEAGLTKAEAERFVAATLAAVVDAVADGDTLTLVGFGAFKPAARAARTGINPKTGEALTIAATTVPRFTAGAGFKSAVAGK